MKAPEMKVKCSVENCHYNESKMCQANGIEVIAMGDGIAKTTDGTGCETFKIKK